ncbi:MAG: putative secreted protein, partial [Clostridiales bacterium]|nr:putative secreted protein [Clostridiales bacterium]
KSSNNTLDGNDPTDRLYYIDFDGMNKTEIYAGLDIFDLKLNENELFFLAISEESEVMKLNKVKKQKVTTIHSSSKEELEAQGCNWFEANTFTLLAANATHVYYGVDFNNGMEMNVYSVGTGGEDHGLYLNAFDIEGMNGSAYFMRGDMDGGYLKILFDCDEDPVEIYLIDLEDKSTIKFEGGYYISGSIDVEEEYVYY